MYFLLKMFFFHCYVSLPEGTSKKGQTNTSLPYHRIVLVLVIGGRDLYYIIPWKAIYTWYTSGMYCQLGDYMLPTTFYKKLKDPVSIFPGCILYWDVDGT